MGLDGIARHYKGQADGTELPGPRVTASASTASPAAASAAAGCGNLALCGGFGNLRALLARWRGARAASATEAPEEEAPATRPKAEELTADTLEDMDFFDYL